MIYCVCYGQRRVPKGTLRLRKFCISRHSRVIKISFCWWRYQNCGARIWCSHYLNRYGITTQLRAIFIYIMPGNWYRCRIYLNRIYPNINVNVILKAKKIWNVFIWHICSNYKNFDYENVCQPNYQEYLKINDKRLEITVIRLCFKSKFFIPFKIIRTQVIGWSRLHAKLQHVIFVYYLRITLMLY